MSWLAHAQAAPDPTPSQASSDTAQLEVIEAPPPDYPLEAAAKGIQGKVVIRLHISETGTVQSAEAISGDPILAKAAENGMKGWKFKPMLKDGKPVETTQDFPYEFVLKVKPGTGCAWVREVEKENAAHHPRVPRDPRVAEGRLLNRVPPEYPQSAKLAHIQGEVMLQGTIGKDGVLHDITPLCGDPQLVQASLDAIRQWRYSPYLLNGEPVEVETTVTVRFHM